MLQALEAIETDLLIRGIAKPSIAFSLKTNGRQIAPAITVTNINGSNTFRPSILTV